MAQPVNPAITGNTRKGSFDAKWASLYSLVDLPQVYPQLVQRYGKRFGVFDFYKMAGRESTCAGASLTMFEEGAYNRYVTLHTTTGTAVAGATLVVEIEEWDTVANGGRSAVAEDDIIFLPAAYCTVSGVKCTLPQRYQVTAIASTTANPDEEDTDITLTPLNALSTVAVAIPSGTKLAVTGGNYAPGSDGPSGKTSGWYSRTFGTAIKKAALTIEGSQVSSDRYIDHIQGGYGILSEATIKAEFRLDQAIDYEMVLGDTTDNLTMVNRSNIANTVRGTKGIMPHLYTSGCKQYYTTSYTIPDFDNIKKAFISQGVTDNNAEFFLGSELLRGIENSGLEFEKEYSGGTDLMKNFGDIDVKIKSVLKNGIRTNLHEINSFSDPNGLGVYNFDKYGFIIPNSQVTVREGQNGAEVKVHNLELKYKSYNGEDRKRIIAPIPGVNGLSAAPNFAVDSYDDASWQLLSEFMVVYYKINQSILVQDDSVL